ncbi:hypothetical protein Pfo_026676 [Paulownia fortunei]|nr:hypothetical protein Pfo_026676 [Paulownia fortunei]
MQRDSTAEAYDNISHKLTQLSATRSKCCIYRVHRHLRNVNDRAYEPEIIAIGPYHRDKHNLKMMEELKWRYLCLLIDEKVQNKERFVSKVGELEQEARKCYAEPVGLSAAEFIEMLVLDGCFIIDLVRKCSMESLRDKNDPIFKMDWMMNILQRDLMLFENQIPFIVLRRLFELIEIPNQENRLIHLLLNFFSNIYPGKGHKLSINRSLDEIKHLLDLIHINWLPSSGVCLDINEVEKDRRKGWKFIQSATKLGEANVKFERSGSDTMFGIKFKSGIMYLPPLIIEDRTESFFRNLIAYEQYFQDTKVSFVTDYVKFFDCLIDSSRDVEILRRHGIVDSWLGDNEVIANMFNKLTDSVTGPGKYFIYAEIFDGVNNHCNASRNRWMAKFRHNYLHSPWTIISIIVAIVLLLLTITQTVSSILQVI